MRPYSEDRDLINTPAFSSYTTGYNVNIANKTDTNGASIFSKVLVTAPDGVVRNYVPTSGLSFLVTTQDDGVTPTASPIVRLRGAWQNSATAGNPSDKEIALYFVSPQYTDAAIIALQNQSVWTLEFVHVNGATANVVQRYRTLARAQSIAEIQQIAFVDLVAAARTELIAASSVNGAFTFGAPSQNDPNNIDFSADGNLDAWTVPQGALAPTSLIAFGRAPFGSTTAGVAGDRFNDGTGVASSARKTVLYCSPQSAGDKHCDSSVGLQYAQGSTVSNFELWARSVRQVEVSKKIGLYKLQ